MIFTNLCETGVADILKKRTEATSQANMVHWEIGLSPFGADGTDFGVNAMPYDPAYPVVCYDGRP